MTMAAAGATVVSLMEALGTMREQLQDVRRLRKS